VKGEGMRQPAKSTEIALLARLDRVDDAAAKAAFLARLDAAERPVVVSFLNAHGFNLALKDPKFHADLVGADYLFRDGIGIALMLRLLSAPAGLNMNGTDLNPEMVQACKGRRVAICGTAEPWLSQGAEVVRSWGNPVVLTMDGFQGHAATVERLLASDAEVFLLAMGMPRQEAVAAELAAKLDRPAVILNGGAIVDFLAGRFPRAPESWRKLHLEWLFRLIQEPGRLWRRYILGGVVFLFHGARLRLQYGPMKHE
jgi:exopolysaccharide biosynthesis WecB/TagA/CpsF family protein